MRRLQPSPVLLCQKLCRLSKIRRFETCVPSVLPSLEYPDLQSDSEVILHLLYLTNPEDLLDHRRRGSVEKFPQMEVHLAMGKMPDCDEIQSTISEIDRCTTY